MHSAAWKRRSFCATQDQPGWSSITGRLGLQQRRPNSVFSRTMGQQSRCLAWTAQLVSFPRKHTEADACKKNPSGWVTCGPWCFFKLSQRWSAAPQAAGAMSAVSHVLQRSVVKLPCL